MSNRPVMPRADRPTHTKPVKSSPVKSNPVKSGPVKSSPAESSPAPKWPSASVTLDQLPIAYIEIDEQGIIRFANEAAYILHEIPSQELIGRQIWDLLPPDEIDASRAAFFANMASGEEPVTIRRSLFNTHGEYRIQEFHRRMLRHENGKPAGISAVIIDVSQLEAAAQKPQHRAVWVESILASLPAPIVVTDPLGFIAYVNPAAEKLTGWSGAELTGSPIEKVFPTPKTGVAFEAGTRSGHNFEKAIEDTCIQPFELRKRDGQQIWVTVTASPVLNKETGYASGLLLSIALGV